MEKKWQPTLITTGETVLHASLLTPEGQRLTPTGKISHAKTRVYTQRYRKEWEQMSDFEGWLTSVPSQPTRAYCLYCKKNLHAHRLSLLKHTCTMKHQRAALLHEVEEEQKKTGWKVEKAEEKISEKIETVEQTQVELEENDDDAEYPVERLDSDDELEEIQKDSTEDTISKVEEDEEEEDDEEEGFDEALQISDYDDVKHSSKKIKIESMGYCEDYTEAMEVQDEYLDDSDDHGNVELEMVVETEDPSNQDEVSILPDMDESDKRLTKNSNENEGTAQTADVKGEKKLEENKTKTSGVMMACSVPILGTSYQMNPPSAPTTIGVLQPVNTIPIAPAQSKTITLTSGGRTVTLTGGTFQPGAQYVLSKLKGNKLLVMADKKNVVAANQTENTSKTVQIIKEQPAVASTSYQNKKHVLLKSVKSSTSKKPRVSTHVVDTSKGIPVGGLQVSLYKLMDGRWTFLNESNTSANGRCVDLVDNMKVNFTAGRYKIHFDVDKYFTLRRIETMYPFIEIVFDVKNPAGHYHIPVLLSPFGYSTYRGSER